MRNSAPPDSDAAAEAFWKKYPTAWGHVTVYLPGYSSDATVAIVVSDYGPMPHGMAEIYLLTKIDGAWTVKDRWTEIFR
jgi:hypothetical protein